MNEENKKTPNDIARQNFKDAGLTYSDIGSKEFFMLVDILKKELEKQKEPLEMTISKRLKRNKPQFNFDENGAMQSAFIKVSSYYFEGREGILFNHRGFIGFAGWADYANTQPFINAFNKWIDKLTTKEGE